MCFAFPCQLTLQQEFISIYILHCKSKELPYGTFSALTIQYSPLVILFFR